MPKPTPSSPPAKRSRSSSSAPSAGSQRRPTKAQQALEEARVGAQLDLIIKLIEEGVSLSAVSRASGISIEDLEEAIAGIPGLARSARVLTADELGQKAAKLANRALDEGMRMLDEGSDSNRLRLITAIANHPLRRMQTDTSDQFAAMQQLLSQILYGGDVIVDEGDDVGEDEPTP